MADTRIVVLWFIRETEKARLFYKLPPERNPGKDDEVWLPKSQIEHTTRYTTNNEHHVTIPDWLADKHNL